eukprot:2975014-Amphidinium_carterae.2
MDSCLQCKDCVLPLFVAPSAALARIAADMPFPTNRGQECMNECTNLFFCFCQAACVTLSDISETTWTRNATLYVVVLCGCSRFGLRGKEEASQDWASDTCGEPEVAVFACEGPQVNG